MSSHSNGRWLKGIGAGLVAALILVTSAVPASAGNAAGPSGYYGPHAGYNYRNQSEIWTNTTVSWAYTIAANQASGNVPSGYMGLLARNYRSNGALCTQRGYYYNSGPASSVSYPTLQSASCGAGSYYSYGVTQAWTGSAYQSYFTFRSPNQNVG
jgi:hypothetical protein